MLNQEDELLLIPGPTYLSSKVREAMARPQLSHVSTEFYNSFKDSLELSRYLFGNTTGIQFLYSGSGTVGMESAIVSLFERGDRVLCLETGYFGHRFGLLSEIHGCMVDTIKSELGKRMDPKVVGEKLGTNNYKAVLFTHVDTSTSVMNDISALSRVARDNDVLALCDSVSAVGGAPLVFDTLGADVVLTGSQKAIAGPPGATILALTMRAMEAMEKRKSPIESYYMNLLRWKPVMDDPKIYLTTPSVQVMLGLHEALAAIKQEGLENRWKRHAKMAQAVRSGLGALGLSPCPDEESVAPTVTAFYIPEKNSGPLQERLRSSYGIHVSRGFGEFRDTMLRVGHFGNISEREVLAFLGCLEMVISGKSGPPRAGRAIEVAMAVLEKK